MRTHAHTDELMTVRMEYYTVHRNSGDNTTFSIQVACISVTVFVRLRRAVQDFMDKTRDTNDAGRYSLRSSSERTKDPKQSRMINVNKYGCSRN